MTKLPKALYIRGWKKNRAGCCSEPCKGIWADLLLPYLTSLPLSFSAWPSGHWGWESVSGVQEWAISCSGGARCSSLSPDGPDCQEGLPELHWGSGHPLGLFHQPLSEMSPPAFTLWASLSQVMHAGGDPGGAPRSGASPVLHMLEPWSWTKVGTPLWTPYRPAHWERLYSLGTCITQGKGS